MNSKIKYKLKFEMQQRSNILDALSADRQSVAYIANDWWSCFIEDWTSDEGEHGSDNVESSGWVEEGNEWEIHNSWD